ncbi:MAG: undecaprenyl-diphosphate phosphatase, partial [Chromatiales bacterium]
MSLFHIVIIALIQGITEFLPISSSGHLILLPGLTDIPDQGLTIDVAVHVGTLVAVLFYFWREVAGMIGGFFRALRGRRSEDGRLLLHVVIATIPVMVAGYFVAVYAGDALRSVEIVGWTTLVFGVLLYIADKVGMTIRRIEHLNVGSAFLIGLAQAIALIPGTSRSGIVMTAGRFYGFERADAARFAMLTSIPTIIAAGALETWEVYEAGAWEVGHDAVIAALISFVVALAAIAWLMQWLRISNFSIFVGYRVLLGTGLLVWFYTGGDLSGLLNSV